MPTFEDVEIQVTQNIDIDFEVYCNTCGAGLCSESDTRKSRRGYLQVSVNCCPYCMEEKEEEIKKLQSEKNYLENKISKLECALYKIESGTQPSNEREAFIFVDIAKQIASEALS